MKLYALITKELCRGIAPDPITYHYGTFSTKEKAQAALDELKEKGDWNGVEEVEFEIEEITLDEPNKMYYFMIED